MSYTIALAGNPNSGKTTLFNELTGAKQHVGNWPGVTVDKKEGLYKKNKELNILDLPGTYSLSPYSAEEIIARDYIVKEKPDVVINIVDGTSIERNLYLSLQILETRIPTVIAVNMIDEVDKKGDTIDFEELSKLLKVPVIPISARSRSNLTKLMEVVEKVAKDSKNKVEKDELASIYDNQTKELLSKVESKLIEAYPTRNINEIKWMAIKVIEADEIILDSFDEKLKSILSLMVSNEEKDKGIDFEAKTADLRYQFISQVVSKTVKRKNIGYVETSSDKMDKVLTNRWLSIPLFAIIMYAMFTITFSENFLFIEGLQSPGIYLASLAEGGWEALTSIVDGLLTNASPWAYSLVIDGVMGGLGAIVGFIPLVLVLFLLISFLEDSGYMARVAFVMDRLFRKFGLSGKSFIPLLMGFGCSVPAMQATRTLENEKDRKITTIITAFMPCGAKLPIFALFVSTMFADDNKTFITYSLYMLSIVIAILVSLFLNKVVYKAEPTSFVMELPQYRIPTLRSVTIHGIEKIKGFVIKAGTIIFFSTILLWLLSNFNADSFNGKNAKINEDSNILSEMDDSFLASIGDVLAPVFKPLGFGEWRPAVGVVTGFIAKENVVVTFAQLYNEDLSKEYLEEYFKEFSKEELEEYGFDNGEYDQEVAADIYSETVLFEGGDENALRTMKDDIKTKAAAYAYMAFNLLCMPCFAAVGAMKKELKTWRLTLGAIGIQMTTAYIVSLLIYQIGSLF